MIRVWLALYLPHNWPSSHLFAHPCRLQYARHFLHAAWIKALAQRAETLKSADDADQAELEKVSLVPLLLAKTSRLVTSMELWLAVAAAVGDLALVLTRRYFP